jgi:parvulin-like peptidyl-prolyl isomerase
MPSLLLSLALPGLLLCPEDAAAPAAPPTATATIASHTAMTDTSPVLTVDGQPVTRAEYEDFLFEQLGPGNMPVFVNELLVRREAKKLGVNITDADAAAFIEDKIRQIQTMPEYAGLDPEEVRKQYRPMAKTMALIETLVRKRRVTEEGVKREFDLRYGEKRRARHILIRPEQKGPGEPSAEAMSAAEKKAQEVHDKLGKGADFAKLAKESSDDPGSAESGGDIPDFGRQDVVPEFADVAFGLKEGETSKPFKSPFGWHIVQLTKVLPQAKELDPKLQEELRGELSKRQVDPEEVQRLFDDLRKGAKVEIKMP